MLGAPIPLCSCGVLPAAAGLRRAGASRSSLSAFLVSTPETGMDSIALSYALLGPIVAGVRPVVAVVSGIAAGCVGLLFGRSTPGGPATHSQADATCAHRDHGQTHPKQPAEGQALPVRIDRALRYGFGTLLDEIAFWLVIGLVTTGVLAALLPDRFFQDALGWEGGLTPMLAMVVAGVPLYICASASTPVAAALIAKGLSPGAALVFLLVGPATNAATLSVGRQILGMPRALTCLASVVVGALTAGALLDLWAAEAVRSAVRTAGPASDVAAWRVIKGVAAASLALLLLRSLARTRFRDGLAEAREQLAIWCDWLRSPRLRGVWAAALLGCALVAAYGFAAARRGAGLALGDPTRPVQAAASIEPLAMLLREVGGERVSVTTLLPAGASPHLFEPRVSDARRLARVQLYFEIGHPLDAWGSNLLAGLAVPPVRLQLLAMEGIEPLPALDPHEHGAEPHDALRAGSDPHLWVDPIRIRDHALPALVATLEALDPAGAGYYRSRRERFAAELTELDRELVELLGGSGARFVALHPAWRYLVARYGLEPIPAVEVIAGEAPPPRRLARTIEDARHAQVDALLVEPQLSARTLRVFAEELGAPIVTLDPIGDPRVRERARYASLMRFNAIALRRASRREGP